MLTPSQHVLESMLLTGQWVLVRGVQLLKMKQHIKKVNLGLKKSDEVCSKLCSDSLDSVWKELTLHDMRLLMVSIQQSCVFSFS